MSNNFEDEMRDVEAAFNRLVNSQAILSEEIKERLDNAIKGGPLPTKAMWQNYFNNNINKACGVWEFSNLYNLSKEHYEDLKKCLFLAENLQYETIKHKIGWGLLTEPGIKAIKSTLKDSDGLLEVGCGSGYWSKVLASRLKIDVQACEINRREDTPKPKYFDALNMSSSEAMDKFPNYDILIVWPDTNSVGLDVIKKVQAGKRLIISGNIEVTGNRQFYEELDKWFDVESHKDAMSFSGVKESTYILKKREAPNVDENYSFFGLHFKKQKEFGLLNQLKKSFEVEKKVIKPK